MPYTYALIAGVLTGTLFSLLAGRREDLPVWVVLDGALAAGVGGVLVGRALYILAHLAYFRENPLEAPAFWYGGLSGFGAVAGGMLGTLFLSARRRWDPLPILNTLAPGASLVVIAAWAGCLQAGCAWGREAWLWTGASLASQPGTFLTCTACGHRGGRAGWGRPLGRHPAGSLLSGPAVPLAQWGSSSGSSFTAWVTSFSPSCAGTSPLGRADFPGSSGPTWGYWRARWHSGESVV